MILIALRAVFVFVMAGVGWFYVNHPSQPLGDFGWLAMVISLTVAVLFLLVDVLSPRRKAMVFAGTFFGLLVGILLAYAISFIIRLLVDQYLPLPPVKTAETALVRETVVQFLNLTSGVVCCYLSISFILQTKDDFRFIIPYVEFRKQLRGTTPLLVDSNALIDGRVVDLARTGLIESSLLVPQYIVDELQHIADSAPRDRRERGRRGLDNLSALLAVPRLDARVLDTHNEEHTKDMLTDQRLVETARHLSARLLTSDANLVKAAEVHGVASINLSDVGKSLRGSLQVGDTLEVSLVKPGQEKGQGVGYLADGTMIVVESGHDDIGRQVVVTITRQIHTSAGQLYFARRAQPVTAAPGAAIPAGRVTAN